MEVEEIILMVAVAADREVRDFSIQTATFIHLIQIQIPMVVTAVHIARTRQIIKVHIFQMVFEIIITVIAVVMQVLQFLLKRWLILTWLLQAIQKCMKTLKTVAGTLQGETCIEMAALAGIGHCQDHKAL